MKIANDTCKWLKIGSTELCGKKCMKEYCKVHLARLRQSPGTTPCTKCGVGTSSVFKICSKCDCHRSHTRKWQRNRREFLRLAAIEV